MSNVTFIEAPFVATHEHATGGRVQVLAIGSPISNPNNRQVVYWNSDKEVFFVALPDFVGNMPDGKRRFRPLNEGFELLAMIQAPTILKGRFHSP